MQINIYIKGSTQEQAWNFSFYLISDVLSIPYFFW